MPVTTGFPSPAPMLFNRTISVLLLQIGREPINVNNNDKYFEALKSRYEMYTKNKDAHNDSTLFLQELQ